MPGEDCVAQKDHIFICVCKKRCWDLRPHFTETSAEQDGSFRTVRIFPGLARWKGQKWQSPQSLTLSAKTYASPLHCDWNRCWKKAKENSFLEWKKSCLPRYINAETTQPPPALVLLWGPRSQCVSFLLLCNKSPHT